MDDVYKMYAMSAGEPTGEPAEFDPNGGEEDDEVEIVAVVTSSDDDEPVAAVGGLGDQ